MNKKMGSNIRKAAVLTAAVASLSFASASWATTDTIKITRDGDGWIGASGTGAITGYSGVNAGQFEFKVNSSTNSLWSAGATFGAFCIDVVNTLKPGLLTYTIQPANGSATIPYDPAFARINWLFDNYAGNGGGGTNTGKDVALQLAVWEVLQETSTTNPFALTTGNFTAGSGFGTARSDANDMLSALNTASVANNYRSNKWDFYSLVPGYNSTNEISQGLLTWVKKPEDPQNPNEISEPGTLLLLSAGLGMIFFSTRRSGAQFASLA
ncbi:MAG: PEP-CTERM sorting domain-containing protein [Solirubrobacterales bacterium]|nr:PEP-CTERM sorting domain-containing protein [Solirubrobacterales bacterium]